METIIGDYIGTSIGIHSPFKGPYYWVLKGSRALTIRFLEAYG